METETRQTDETSTNCFSGCLLVALHIIFTQSKIMLQVWSKKDLFAFVLSGATNHAVEYCALMQFI